mmetsp:Transcript_50754/g.120897  ORF Transcript_50754/g.120897 Transcript_50754/m.120897 type:complete len:314 (-) Transcript_50754:416-1357(-)
MPSDDLLWVFGYGSLIWKPPEGFTPVENVPGAIHGYTRKFWQGSTDHRGVPGAPGLVATLLRNSDIPKEHLSGAADDEVCWGMCYGYAAAQREEVMAYLDFREKDGYVRETVDVHLRLEGAPDGTAQPAASLHGVLVYVATIDNPQYLGPLTNQQVAAQIAGSVGPSGLNSAYLYNLCDGLRTLKVTDGHVLDVEAQVRALPQLAEGTKVSAFTGDGESKGDGGWMLQRLWDSGKWQKVESSEKGIFLGAAGSFDALLATIGSTQEIEPATVALGDAKMAAQVVMFKDGGALLNAGEKVLLCTQSALESFVTA